MTTFCFVSTVYVPWQHTSLTAYHLFRQRDEQLYQLADAGPDSKLISFFVSKKYDLSLETDADFIRLMLGDPMSKDIDFEDCKHIDTESESDSYRSFGQMPFLGYIIGYYLAHRLSSQGDHFVKVDLSHLFDSKYLIIGRLSEGDLFLGRLSSGDILGFRHPIGLFMDCLRGGSPTGFVGVFWCRNYKKFLMM